MLVNITWLLGRMTSKRCIDKNTTKIIQISLILLFSKSKDNKLLIILQFAMYYRGLPEQCKNKCLFLQWLHISPVQSVWHPLLQWPVTVPLVPTDLSEFLDTVRSIRVFWTFCEMWHFNEEDFFLGGGGEWH